METKITKAINENTKEQNIDLAVDAIMSVMLEDKSDEEIIAYTLIIQVMKQTKPKIFSEAVEVFLEMYFVSQTEFNEQMSTMNVEILH